MDPAVPRKTCGGFHWGPSSQSDNSCTSTSWATAPMSKSPEQPPLGAEPGGRRGVHAAQTGLVGRTWGDGSHDLMGRPPRLLSEPTGLRQLQLDLGPCPPKQGLALGAKGVPCRSLQERKRSPQIAGSEHTANGRLAAANCCLLLIK